MGPLATVNLSELAVFRLNIPVNALENSPLRFKFTFYQLIQDKIESVLDEVTI